MMHQFNSNLEKKHFRPYCTLLFIGHRSAVRSLHSINDGDCPSNKLEQNSVWEKQKPIGDVERGLLTLSTSTGPNPPPVSAPTLHPGCCPRFRRGCGLLLLDSH
jgi:hypothetical protein